MKSLIFKIFKIFSVISGIGAIFFFGSNLVRKKEQLKQENDELQKDIKITKKVNSLSFFDKSNFLLSKQRNKNNK
jgi:hypothetical protein